MSFRLKICACAIALVSASGCVYYPTAINAETFETIVEGRYDPSKQALLADCMFDGWDTVMNYAAFSQARLVKRASGYRLDAISLTNKLLTADLRDDGVITIARMKARSMSTTLGPEIAAAMTCLNRYDVTYKQVGTP
ncbi:hypothetical protein SAMN05518845_11941 [Variovorax sp. YR750]|uniref:hypothetical protein n=1 Tax=Variovorax sp. YR750 TaxID=1884384 RepID=UPI0008ADB802|nr:hypothetical protein [Variovorax sp. YR750]SEM25760.1 hypothetical protein SAMN05518845_11941 [Variovorax sp. YR750]